MSCDWTSNKSDLFALLVWLKRFHLLITCSCCLKCNVSEKNNKMKNRNNGNNIIKEATTSILLIEHLLCVCVSVCLCVTILYCTHYNTSYVLQQTYVLQHTYVLLLYKYAQSKCNQLLDQAQSYQKRTVRTIFPSTSTCLEYCTVRPLRA